MATEYKLSYAASEIDRKLGKVDTLVSSINGVSPDANGNVELEVNSNIVMPEYVKNESDRVVKKVLNIQNGNTFSFIAVSDIHYSTEHAENNEDGYLKDLSCALIEVNKQLALDVNVNLGDIVWGSVLTEDEDTVEEARVVNKYINEGLAGVQNIRTLGNHDTMYNTVSNRFSFLNAYNKGAVYGNREQGYCYYDLTDVKTRIIALNTSEIESGYSAAINTSIEQRKWLGSVLAETANKTGWNILFLAHMPFDWYCSDSDTTVFDILKAYENGTTVTVDSETFDYSKESRAEIIAQIHGHLHNFKVHKLEGTRISRICVPNACYARTNEYSNTNNYPETDFQQLFGNETTYAKTLNTKDSTAFNVITIDPVNKKIYATNYGAGIDREIDYIGAATYAVANNLTNVTTDNSITSISEGSAYTATLNAVSGYDISSVSIIMGGEDITLSAYNNGAISIAEVTGDIIITASASKQSAGDIIDEVGYTDGKRLSASTGEFRDATGYTTTGMIDLTGYKKPITIQATGCNFDSSSYNNCAWVGYSDASGTFQTADYISTTYNHNSDITNTFDENGNLTMVIGSNGTAFDLQYIRLCGYGSGANLDILITEG